VLSIFVTGGIGSGKSTLMEFLKEKGVGIVLADEVGHENLHNPEMKAELVKAFGKEILDTNGEIIRSELAARAFATPEDTARMDAITQPRLYEGCLRHVVSVGQTHEVVVLEMAILDGRDDFYKHADIVVAVTTSPEVRVRRLMESRGFSEEDARNRLASQVPEENRLAIADVVFTNDGTLQEFQDQIQQWWNSDIAPRLS
jgi:dephospho-CoA kinase